MVVSDGGDLELWHASDSGTTTRVMAGTSVTITKITLGADLAEIYGTKDISIEPGDVVSLDESLIAGVKKSSKPYDSDAIGIISTSPSLVIGNLEDAGAMPAMVALSGRVPVKVSTENGPIQPGDLLTTSSIPGVAMRATKAGQIIGQAMSEFDGEGVGRVVVFIKTDYGNGAALIDTFPGLSQGDEESITSGMGKLALAELMSQKELLATSVNLSEINTDRLVAGLEIITPTLIADKVETNTIISLEEGKYEIDSSGNALFAGDITADGLVINSHIRGSQDVTGTAVIPAGKTSTYIKFSQPYEFTPNVTVSASDFVAVKVGNKSVKGFLLSIAKARPSNVSIDWFAVEPGQ